MTDGQKESAVRRAVSIVGPWPFHPVVLGVVLALVWVIGTLGFYVRTTVLATPAIAVELIPAVLAGSVIGLIAAAGRAWQRRHGVHWSSYLVTVAVMSTVTSVFRAVVPGTPDLPAGSLSIAGTMLRNAILIATISAIVGRVTQRLEQQVAETASALEIARHQQRAIIAADEDARRQASLFLHDRVQARLLTIGLELRDIADRIAPQERAALTPLIQQLETLRSLDLRTAARALSPNLDDVDLQTALEELAVQYEIAFQVEVNVDPRIDDLRRELGSQMLLAVYRIVEQGLVNVAAHADAQRVVVSVEVTPGSIELSVADDGSGISDHPARGLGATIISAWTSAVGGSWGWRRRGGGGTVLYADLPASDRGR